MVADELAIDLTKRFVRADQTIVDPFCGSGRLLASSCTLPGLRVGIDVNPLACLIARAKLARVDSDVLAEIAAESRNVAEKFAGAEPLRLGTGRKVEWFSQPALKQLAEIIAWIDAMRLEAGEKLVLAASLSAVARDASYARKLGWKLHRMGESERLSHSTSAWEILARRLDYCASASRSHQLASEARIEEADVTNGETLSDLRGKADLILTSPPYGDSRTTVQYGAASELCLEVVSHLQGFETYESSGGKIDRRCLGGGASAQSDERLPLFWSGRQDGPEARGAARFLGSLSSACRTIDELLRPGGSAVFVVGRRSTGGYRLRLDEFLCDEMAHRGLALTLLKRRALKWKRVPQHVNRFARSTSAEKRAAGLLPTMRDEIILAFSKPVEVAAAASAGENFHVPAAAKVEAGERHVSRERPSAADVNL